MIRLLNPDEVSLCIEGGKSFFDEGNMPGGFDPDHFAKAWGSIIQTGRGSIIGSFEGETIAGALGAILCPNLFNRRQFAVESFWYVLPEFRNSLHGIRLLREYERWARDKGLDDAFMIHLENLQPERLKGIYERFGYSLIETNYHKRLKES